MKNTDPRFDAYIAKAAEFAQPILKHLRRVVHEACPEVVETMKWSMPFFEHHGILCGMAAFKQHCTFGIWKWDLLTGNQGVSRDEAMGSFGRVATLADLPEEKVLIAYLREAAKLNETGVKKPRTAPKERKELVVPEDLTTALAGNAAARKTFEGFSYSNRKDYVEWLTEAKTDATRQKRLATTLEWLAEGKVRNWKYLKC